MHPNLRQIALAATAALASLAPGQEKSAQKPDPKPAYTFVIEVEHAGRTVTFASRSAPTFTGDAVSFTGRKMILGKNSELVPSGKSLALRYPRNKKGTVVTSTPVLGDDCLAAADEPGIPPQLKMEPSTQWVGNAQLPRKVPLSYEHKLANQMEIWIWCYLVLNGTEEFPADATYEVTSWGNKPYDPPREHRNPGSADVVFYLGLWRGQMSPDFLVVTATAKGKTSHFAIPVTRIFKEDGEYAMVGQTVRLRESLFTSGK